MPKNQIQKIHHWRINFAIMFIAQFLSGVGFSFVLPFFPFYFRTLGVNSESDVLLWMGWSSAAFGISMAVSAPFWGVLADKFGRKIMVLRSMFAGSIILSLMGLSTSPWHLLILRVFQGAMTGTVTASITLVSSITPSANLGISLGLMQTALLLGQGVGPFIGGMLSEKYGFRVPCGLAGIIMIAGTLLVLFGASEIFVPPKDNKNNSLKTMKSILQTQGFKLILSIYFLTYVLSTMIIPILPLYIEQLSGKTTGAISLTGIFVALTGFLMGFSAVVYGKLGDRFGYSRILVISLVLTGLICIPQSFANSIMALFIERCLFGIAAGGILPSVNALVSNTISKERVGSAYGLTSGITCLGMGIGPLLGGTIASIFGLRWPFVIMGISALIVAVIIQIIFNKSGKTLG